MQPQILEQTHQAADLFNLLTQSGPSTALVFALILGLGLAQFMRVPAYLWIERDALAAWTCYAACILGAFLACWWLWPADGPWRARLAFSLSVAFITPLVWILIVVAVGFIRPQWGKALSLHRISFDDSPPANPDPSKDNQT